MSIVIDTNILLRSAEPSHAQHAVADHAVRILIAHNEILCVVPQVLYEFWVAATRPVPQNGLGWIGSK